MNQKQKCYSKYKLNQRAWRRRVGEEKVTHGHCHALPCLQAPSRLCHYYYYATVSTHLPPPKCLSGMDRIGFWGKGQGMVWWGQRCAGNGPVPAVCSQARGGGSMVAGNGNPGKNGGRYACSRCEVGGVGGEESLVRVGDRRIHPQWEGSCPPGNGR